MFLLLLCGILFLPVLTVLLIGRWVSGKRRELDGEQFRLWFQKTCMGMEPDDQAINQASQQGKKKETAAAVVR